MKTKLIKVFTKNINIFKQIIMMRKTLSIILLSFLLSVFQSCSTDGQRTYEEDLQLIEEINEKNALVGDSDPIIEGCTIEYTYHNPNLTPAQKNAIRNSYFFFHSYTIDPETGREIWIVNCTLFYDYQDDNPNCDIDGCYVITSGCPRGGCASTPPKDPNPLDHDPFGDDQ